MLDRLAALQPLLVCAASVPVIFFLMVAVGRTLKRRFGVRMGAYYRTLCLAFAVWAPLVAYERHYPISEDWSWISSVSPHLGALLVICAALLLIALVRRFYWELWFEKKTGASAPKFLSEVAALLIFIAALLVVMRFVYGQSVAGLALGSTVVAAILGFALQDLLGNIIAGISLEMGKPFRVGDWLIVDQQRAEVMEVNWRSTRLRTTDDVYLDLPNRLIVGTKIINLTYPTPLHALRMHVGFEHSAPPNHVKDCLKKAASQARGVLREPAPSVYLKDFAESSIDYEIKFWIEDESKYTSIMDAVRTNIWYQAQRDRLRLPFPIRTIQIERRTAAHGNEPLETARACVRKQPFFQLLEEDQIDNILRQSRVLRFGRGETVIEQGASGHSMFVLLEGEADVLVKINGTDTQVAALHSGDYCGEMSLLTGEPRSATVVARSDCQMCEIEKPVLGALLQENEPLVRKLGELLAHRRLENEGVLANASTQQLEKKEIEYTETFLKRLSAFFQL